MIASTLVVHLLLTCYKQKCQSAALKYYFLSFMTSNTSTGPIITVQPLLVLTNFMNVCMRRK